MPFIVLFCTLDITKSLPTWPGYEATKSLAVSPAVTHFAMVDSCLSFPQDVLRNWHSRDERIVQTMKDLVDNAHASERAFESGSLIVHAQTCVTVMPLRLL